MSKGIGLFLCLVAIQSSAMCSREQGMEFIRMFERSTAGNVRTNGSECVRTVVDNQGEYRFFYSDKRGLRRVRFERSDGDVFIYDYCNGILDTGAFSKVDSLSGTNAIMTITMFVSDGRKSNCVDRIESDYYAGRVIATRMLDIDGRPISGSTTPKQGMIVDVEYAPQPGSRTRIGPYDWVVVEKNHGESVFLHDGKKILHGGLLIGGRWPWIVGRMSQYPDDDDRKMLAEKGLQIASSQNRVNCVFVLDVRSDEIVYFPLEDLDRVESLTGSAFSTYTRGMGSFWEYGLSKNGSKRRAKLEADLKFLQTARGEAMGCH